VARPSKKTTEDKVRIVLSVLRGDTTAAEAGRKNGVSEQSIHNWKRLFLEAGRAGLDQGARRRSSREHELEAENEELKAALGEAHVQLRVWKKGAEFLPPSRTSR
jgi:transposase